MALGVCTWDSQARPSLACPSHLRLSCLLWLSFLAGLLRRGAGSRAGGTEGAVQPKPPRRSPSPTPWGSDLGGTGGWAAAAGASGPVV